MVKAGGGSVYVLGSAVPSGSFVRKVAVVDDSNNTARRSCIADGYLLTSPLALVNYVAMGRKLV